MDAPSLIRATLVAATAMLGAVPGTSGVADTLPGVTVEAERQREKLKHDVDEFVSAAIVQSHNEESLERWTYDQICPQVAGLNKAQGEFILARLSQIARTAGAPLAPENCKPNFFVIVSADPEPGLKQVADRKGGQAFNYETGERLKKFIETPRPIRVWYNAGSTSIDGASMVSGILDTSSVHARKFGSARGLDPVYNVLPSQYGSRLNVATATRDILSVIVIIDSTKVRDLNFGQLADYIGMIGLAEIDLDKNRGDAPTILSLFRGSGQSRPGEMTAWDKALLHALYSTSQRSKMQMSQIQTTALNEIASASTH